MDPFMLRWCEKKDPWIFQYSLKHNWSTKKMQFRGLSRPESGFLNRTVVIVRLVDIYTRIYSYWFSAIPLRLIFPELPVRKGHIREDPRIPSFFGQVSRLTPRFTTFSSSSSMNSWNMCTYSTHRKFLEVLEDPWILFGDIV